MTDLAPAADLIQQEAEFNAAYEVYEAAEVGVEEIGQRVAAVRPPAPVVVKVSRELGKPFLAMSDDEFREDHPTVVAVQGD